MRWFKHLLGNSEGDSQFISELVCEFGPDGYYVFYRTLEIMCGEFNVNKPAENEFHFDLFFSKFLRISPKKLKTILIFCSNKYQETKGKKGIYFKLNGNHISLRCCKLKELADQYTQKELAKLQIKSVDTTDKVQTNKGDIELDLDLDIDKNNYSTPEASKAALWNFTKDLEKTFADVKQFVGKMKKLKHTDEGIAHTLKRYKEESEKGNEIALENPWGFCLKILKEDEAKANARVSEKKHFEIKKQDKNKAPEHIKKVFDGFKT